MCRWYIIFNTLVPLYVLQIWRLLLSPCTIRIKLNEINIRVAGSYILNYRRNVYFAHFTIMGEATFSQHFPAAPAGVVGMNSRWPWTANTFSLDAGPSSFERGTLPTSKCPCIWSRFSQISHADEFNLRIPKELANPPLCFTLSATKHEFKGP